MASHGMVDVSAPSPPSVLRKPLEVMVGGLLPDLHSNHLDLKANLRLSGLYIRFLTRCDKSRCSLLGGWDPQSSGGGRVGGSLGLGGLYAIALNLIFLQKETLERNNPSFTMLVFWRIISFHSLSSYKPQSLHPHFCFVFCPYFKLHDISPCSRYRHRCVGLISPWIVTLLSGLLILCPHALRLHWLCFSHLTFERQRKG